MPEAECDCHNYCDRGSKPSDCNLTRIDTQTVEWGYPANLKVKSLNEGDDIIHRKAYCSVHGIYSYKEPVVIEVDWNKWKNRRAPEELRDIPHH